MLLKPNDTTGSMPCNILSEHKMAVSQSDTIEFWPIKYTLVTFFCAGWAYPTWSIKNFQEKNEKKNHGECLLSQFSGLQVVVVI